MASSQLRSGSPQDYSTSIPAQILRRWLGDRGIYVHPDIWLSEDERADGTPCVRLARRASLKKDTVVAVIPKSRLLSPRTSGLAHCLTNDPRNLFSPEARCGLLLSTCLLYEALRGKRSPWYGYIQSLPRERMFDGMPQLGIFLPFEWSDNSPEWLAIKHCETGRIILRAQRCDDLPRNKAQATAKHHVTNHFRSCTLPLLRRTDVIVPQDIHQLESLFIGCFSIVSSRAFVCDIVHGMALCPLADAFNHADYGENDVEFQCDDAPPSSPGDDTIEIVMTRSRDATGADSYSSLELYNSYGRLSNPRLLVSYGFALEDTTPFERFTWDFDDAAERQEMCELLGSLGAIDEPIQMSCVPERRKSASPPSGRALISSLTSLDLQHTPETLVFLRFFVAIEEDEEDDEGNAYSDPESLDAHLPLFIDEHSRISVALWRLVVLAVMESRSLASTPELIKSKMRAAEQAVARLWGSIVADRTGIAPTASGDDTRAEIGILLDALGMLEGLVDRRLRCLTNVSLGDISPPTMLYATRQWRQEKLTMEQTLHNIGMLRSKAQG